MEDASLVPSGTPALSQGARVIDTFVAPRKTFTDILRSASCWLPLVIFALVTIGWSVAIDKTVGFQAASETQMAKNPKAEEQMQQLPPDQRAQRMSITTKITRFSSYASIVFVLIFMLLEALVLWAAFNFGLGAQTRFGQVFAVIAYAGLPRCLMWILSAALLFGGVGHDNFDMRNPVGTNLGYFLQDSPHWMQVAGSFFDVFGLWALALLVIGMAIISRKKISQSAIVIVGLWVLALLITTGVAAV